jgi:hypothetical protein
MNLAEPLFWFALVLSGLNWVLFASLAFIANALQFKKLINALLARDKGELPKEGLDRVGLQAGFDPSKLGATIGTLATAFGKSGPAASAAAMAVFFALIAAIASGIDSFAR